MSAAPKHTRRGVLKSAAWSVPVIAASIAIPAAAASTAPVQPTKSRIAFTNATATVGAAANTLYLNTKVKVLDGPAPVNGLLLTITITAPGFEQVEHYVWPPLAGWGTTALVSLTTPNVPNGTPVTITFHANADDCAPINATVIVTPPGWWA